MPFKLYGLSQFVFTKILSLTKLCSGSPEFFNSASTFRLFCLSLHFPILAKVLLRWFSQNLPSDHPRYLTRFFVRHNPPGDRSCLACLQQESLQASLARILSSLHVSSQRFSIHQCSLALWLSIPTWLCCIWNRVQSLPQQQAPISVVPTPIAKPPQVKSSLLSCYKCH